jgi:hypothetical protein
VFVVNEVLRLGIIGLSPGNGHPYSWAAIFNGYNESEMERCGFPVIPRYLERQSFPEAAIKGAAVTHVWTQEPAVSQHVARAARINYVVDDMHDLLGKVDAVLLARDDAERHLEFAKPFLDASVPIYIDKPLALDVASAREMFALQRYPWQLFSCSALRYAREFALTEGQRTGLGGIKAIHATVPKDWDKYSIHVIEPMLSLLPDRGALLRSERWASDDRVALHLEWQSGAEALVSSMGERARTPLGLRVFGSSDWCDLIFSDTFSAFRSALAAFVEGVRMKRRQIPLSETLDAIKLVEVGRSL